MTSVGAVSMLPRRITLIVVLNMIVKLEALHVRCFSGVTRMKMKIGMTTPRGQFTYEPSTLLSRTLSTGVKTVVELNIVTFTITTTKTLSVHTIIRQERERWGE